MYCYLYGERLSQPGFLRTLASIEMRLHDLDIQGNICRLSPAKNLRDLIRQELAHNVKTIVAVGDDIVVERVITIVASQQLKVVVGIIPAGPGSHDIARSLSIPLGVDSCNILSYRMIQTLRLGKVNNRYFLTKVECKGYFSVDCDGLFRVSPAYKTTASIRITNNPYEPSSKTRPSPPLRLSFLPDPARPWLGHHACESSFLNNRFTILARDRVAITIDDHNAVITPPVVIESSNIQLRLITGALRPSIRSTLTAQQQKIADHKAPQQPLSW